MKLSSGSVIGLLVLEGQANPLSNGTLAGDDGGSLFGNGRDGPRLERALIHQVKMFEFFNPNFEFQKYWLYGCSCYVKGKNTFNAPSLGSPVDDLDSICQNYRNCLKCARDTIGSWCESDSIGYGYTFNEESKGKDVQCTDAPSTCNRAICECDRTFTSEHARLSPTWNPDFHETATTTGWSIDQCHRGGGGGGGGERNMNKQCCGGHTSPFHIYNPRYHQCCENGSLKGIEESC